MITIHHYSENIIKHLQTCKYGFRTWRDYKRSEAYPQWYSGRNVIDFSRGRRDFIIGYVDEYYKEEIPIILNKKYKKEVLEDGTVVVSHYNFNWRVEPPKWEKETYICNEKPGLKLIEYTKLSKEERKQYQ